MMNPKLVMNGKAYRISSIDFLEGSPSIAVIEKDGQNVVVFNGASELDEEMVNLSDTIQFEIEGRYDPVIKAIDDIIEVNLIALNSGANEIFHSVMEGEFIDDTTVAACHEFIKTLDSLHMMKEIVDEIIMLEAERGD